MLIDWFTVGAQAINFVILVWLLKRFLYKPILRAIDAREKHVATELADADAKRAEAHAERDDFQKKNQAFDAERGVLLSKATDDAKVERARLLDEARRAAEALRLREEKALQSERTTLGHEITRLASDEVFGIARRALGDLAAASLEERMGEVFTRRLRELDGNAKAALGAVLKASPEPARLRSTFELPVGPRAAIQNALNETFSAEIRIQYETAPDGVCGVELTTNGQSLGWSIASYLKSLGGKLDALLETHAAAAATPPSIPGPSSAALAPPAETK